MSGLPDELPPSTTSGDPASAESEAFAVATQIADYYAAESLSVKFYDAVSRADRAVDGDTDFYCRRLGPAPKRVLELGCGTGRVALALAAEGYSVLGIDLAEPMLRRAVAKRQRLPPAEARNVQFRLHDLLTLELPYRFDAVLVPFYTINHLSGRAQRVQALKTIARHLKPGGISVIHACSPERLREKLGPKRPGMVINFEPSNSRLEVTWNLPALDEGRRKRTQLVEYQYIGADRSLLQASTERLTYFWFPDSEVERAAHQVGLKPIETLTSFTGEQGGERIYVFERLSLSPAARASQASRG